MRTHGEAHSIHLELRLDGAAPTGHVRFEDGDARPFSGWMGLVCVIEELITETREPLRTAP